MPASVPLRQRGAPPAALAPWLVGAAVAGTALVGCRPEANPERSSALPAWSPSSEPSTPAGRLGAPVQAEHYVIEASAFEPCGPAPKRGARTRRVGVELKIERRGRVQVPANPYYALLVDTAGDVHEATLGGCGTPLAPALPAPGEAARGWVVFEVPATSRDFTLLYDPELVEVPERPVSISLKR